MGARGPNPNPNSVTRHKPKQRRRTLTAAAVEIPELTGTHDAATWTWWDTWVNSPQAEVLTATDWQTLVRLVPLMDLFAEKPTAQLASEIRQTEAKLGATIADRDRLGMNIDPPQAGADHASPGGGSSKRRDPRKAAS